MNQMLIYLILYYQTDLESSRLSHILSRDLSSLDNVESSLVNSNRRDNWVRDLLESVIIDWFFAIATACEIDTYLREFVDISRIESCFFQ